jgi:amino acid transporter
VSESSAILRWIVPVPSRLCAITRIVISALAEVAVAALVIPNASPISNSIMMFYDPQHQPHGLRPWWISAILTLPVFAVVCALPLWLSTRPRDRWAAFYLSAIGLVLGLIEWSVLLGKSPQ